MEENKPKLNVVGVGKEQQTYIKDVFGDLFIAGIQAIKDAQKENPLHQTVRPEGIMATAAEFGPINGIRKLNPEEEKSYSEWRHKK